MATDIDSKQEFAEHTIDVNATPEAIYELIADVTRWPAIFPPTLHARVLESAGTEQRIQLWANANGEPKTWTSRRELRPDELTVTFGQEVSAAPVRSMSGVWLIEAAPGDTAHVRLQHTYSAIDDDPAHLRWIAEAVDSNSHRELAAVKATAEGPAHSGPFEFSDAVTVETKDRRAAYEFIADGARWDERLPHVDGVDLREIGDDLQILGLRTRAQDGSVHTTESVRILFPDNSISYKQTTLPALLDLHLGEWTFRDTPGGVEVVSRHAVVIHEEAIPAVLGPEATSDDARTFIRNALGGNSRATLHELRRSIV